MRTRVQLSCGCGELTGAGNRVLVVDRNFVAYFYAVVAEGFDASKVANAIMKGFGSSIVKTEVADRRFFGKPVTGNKSLLQGRNRNR